MTSKMFDPAEKNASYIQTDECDTAECDSEIEKKCAGCGEERPEYRLDERQLCYDCYKAEKYYWTK